MSRQFFLRMPTSCHGDDLRTNRPRTTHIERCIANHPQFVGIHGPVEMTPDLCDGHPRHIIPFVMFISKPTADKVVPQSKMSQFVLRPSFDVSSQQTEKNILTLTKIF